MQIAPYMSVILEMIRLGLTLIFKDNPHPRKGVAIRRPREGEDGMPTLIVPWDGIEKAELDYIVEEKAVSEKERIDAGKPLIERRLDDQGEYERKVKHGDG